jgi:hypothetical protein
MIQVNRPNFLCNICTNQCVTPQSDPTVKLGLQPHFASYRHIIHPLHVPFLARAYGAGPARGVRLVLHQMFYRWVSRIKT